MIYAVIMAGGRGERFWPASRRDIPKHLLQHFGEKTLLEATVERIRELVPAENIIIVTNIDQTEKIKKIFPKIPENNIISEPLSRNTAPCIGIAARYIQSFDANGMMVVLPADHIIDREKEFIRNLSDAVKVAEKNRNLITFGIKPYGPETGYGYIKVGEKIKNGLKTMFGVVDGFFEKPDSRTALKYYETGNYLWNSGMFVWRCDVILNAINKSLPEMHKKICSLNISRDQPIDFADLKRVYESINGISIDFGVMEKEKNVLVASSDFVWDDVGSWTALERHGETDENGNISNGEFINFDTKGCIISGDKRLIATAGVKDLIIVETEDALLICNKKNAQDVKKIVAKLKEEDKYFKYL
ncbi:mannose-1-phosphate guanylyltransferase [Chlamydiota bacterium]